MKQITTLFLLFFANILFSQTLRSIKNKDMKVVEMKQLDCKDEKCTITKWTRDEYDKKGNILVEIEYYADSTYRNYDTYVYNRKGMVVEHNEFDKQGKLSKKTVSEYDNLKDKKVDKVYNAKNELIEEVRYKFNAFDLKTEELTLKPDGSVLKKSTYRYDDKGSLIERKTVNEKGQETQQRVYSLKYY